MASRLCLRTHRGAPDYRMALLDARRVLRRRSQGRRGRCPSVHQTHQREQAAAHAAVLHQPFQSQVPLGVARLQDLRARRRKEWPKDRPTQISQHRAVCPYPGPLAHEVRSRHHGGVLPQHAFDRKPRPWSSTRPASLAATTSPCSGRARTNSSTASPRSSRSSSPPSRSNLA